MLAFDCDFVQQMSMVRAAIGGRQPNLIGHTLPATEDTLKFGEVCCDWHAEYHMRSKIFQRIDATDISSISDISLRLHTIFQ